MNNRVNNEFGVKNDLIPLKLVYVAFCGGRRESKFHLLCDEMTEVELWLAEPEVSHSLEG